MSVLLTTLTQILINLVTFQLPILARVSKPRGQTNLEGIGATVRLSV